MCDEDRFVARKIIGVSAIFVPSVGETLGFRNNFAKFKPRIRNIPRTFQNKLSLYCTSPLPDGKPLLEASLRNYLLSHSCLGRNGTTCGIAGWYLRGVIAFSHFYGGNQSFLGQGNELEWHHFSGMESKICSMERSV